MISYIIPTRDRPERLHATLEAISGLGEHDAELIVADNGSEERPILPAHLSSGVPLTYLNLGENLGAAARNLAAMASDPRSDWLVMLDDDSHPNGAEFVPELEGMAGDVGAVMADVFLPPLHEGKPRVEGHHRAAGPGSRRAQLGGGTGWLHGSGRRESGGLPEVFIGCGVAIRREVFLRLGGYDRAFGYYAEEYDLSARMLMAGHRMVFEPNFRVTHHKVAHGRDMNQILARLVRNNGWVVQRYAPEHERRGRRHETLRRYRSIAGLEGALAGYSEGVAELRRTVRGQHRTPMPIALWERFTGLAHARGALRAAHSDRPFSSAAILDDGKNCWAVVRALNELGVRLYPDHDDAEVLVIGTMSPGPMLDALERRQTAPWHGPRVIAPWLRAPQILAAGHSATTI